MPATATCAEFIEPMTLDRTIAAISSGVVAAKLTPVRAKPALCNQMSTGPKLRTAKSHRACTCARSATSQAWPMTAPAPTTASASNRSMAASTDGWLRPLTTTWWPRCRKACA